MTVVLKQVIPVIPKVPQEFGPPPPVKPAPVYVPDEPVVVETGVPTPQQTQG